MNLKTFLRKLIFPNTYSSKAFVKYLKNAGIEIGDNCYIWSPNQTFIDTQRPEMLTIGDYCKIAKGVTILCHDYSMSVARRKYHRHVGHSAKTTIGSNVFIGMNATILMGSQIGDNCIVGAGAIVSGIFTDNVVIAGNPARVVCTLDEYYTKHVEREYNCAKDYVRIFEEKRGRKPTIEEMGNSYAWMYLPRTQQSVRDYNNFFRLNGDNYDEIVEDFLHSKGIFPSYEAFLDSLERIREEKNDKKN